MGFEDLAFLFKCDNLNRGTIRINFDEAALLWKAVKRSEGDILEIGRLFGGTLALIRHAADDDRRVVSVDLDNDRIKVDPSWHEGVEILTQNSQIPIAGSWGLLFVDGDHTLPGVVADLATHWDNVVDGGLVVFHDAMPYINHMGEYRPCSGPSTVREQLLTLGVGSYVEHATSMVVMRKVKPLGTALRSLGHR